VLADPKLLGKYVTRLTELAPTRGDSKSVGRSHIKLASLLWLV